MFLTVTPTLAALDLCWCITKRVFHEAHTFARYCTSCSLKHLQTSHRGTLTTLSMVHVQFLLHLPVFLHHLPRCKFGISCSSPGMKPDYSSPMLVSPHQPSVNYYFPNVHGMRYHLDASTIPTMSDVHFHLKMCTITLSLHSTGIFSCSNIILFCNRYNNNPSQAVPHLHWNSVWPHRLQFFILLSATCISSV